MAGRDCIELPLVAYAPRPQIEFDDFVNLGAVVLDNNAFKAVEFSNIGAKVCMDYCRRNSLRLHFGYVGCGCN